MMNRISWQGSKSALDRVAGKLLGTFMVKLFVMQV